MSLHSETPIHASDGSPVGVRVEGNLFSALGFDESESAALAARADLAAALASFIREQGWTQTVAAKHLGTTQARISALVRGRVTDLSLDALVTMAARAGLHLRLTASRPRARRKPTTTS